MRLVIFCRKEALDCPGHLPAYMIAELPDLCSLFVSVTWGDMITSKKILYPGFSEFLRSKLQKDRQQVKPTRFFVLLHGGTVWLRELHVIPRHEGMWSMLGIAVQEFNFM